MKSVARLKEQARLHEQKEEWEKAIQAYEQVLQLADPAEGDLELSLYNRIGDLHLRLGRQPEAVAHYIQAADVYAESGLYNNAIALCNKALRYVPNRADLYRKLGQLSAAQGFITDARRAFLEYAERKLRSGDRVEALEALEEFAELSSDPEIRETIAQHLISHGAADEAVDQLRHAYRLYLIDGSLDGADAARTKLLELDPEIDLSEVEAEAAAAMKVAEETEEATPADAALPRIALQTAADAAGIDEPDPDAPPADAGDAATPIEIEPTAIADTDDIVDSVAALTSPESADPDELDPDAAEVDPLPLLGIAGDSGDADPNEDDALGGIGGLPPLEPADGLDGDGDDPADLLDRARALVAARHVARAVRELERFDHEAADPVEVETALEILGDLVAAAPDECEAHRLRAACAVRTEDPRRMVEAYLDLAACLDRAGADSEAIAVYTRVLDLDPSNAIAGVAVQGAAPKPVPESHGDYVDLAALIHEEDDDEATTRFVVDAKPPSGDEDQDFMDLLSEFKAKVSEHVGLDDPASHYDLGLAFKEMGLIDEAVAEFQIALRGGKDRLKIHEELGHCFMLRGQFNIAVKILARSLQLPYDDETELLGVFYQLARCHEELGQIAEARDALERVVALDINFRDAAGRLAAL